MNRLRYCQGTCPAPCSVSNTTGTPACAIPCAVALDSAKGVVWSSVPLKNSVGASARNRRRPA